MAKFLGLHIGKVSHWGEASEEAPGREIQDLKSINGQGAYSRNLGCSGKL